MSRHQSSSRRPETDYATIEAAVMETARGRWFLAEYARRNRAADTKSILKAIARLEEMAGLLEAAPTTERGSLRSSLKAIGEIRETPWQGILDRDERPLHERPAEASRNAHAALRRSAEKIREVAVELRETGKHDLYANALELYCADVVSAASLQEAALNRLTDLARVVATIEALPTASVAGNEVGRSIKDCGERTKADDAAENPPIAPSDPPRLSGQPSPKKESQPTTDEQSAPSVKRDAPVLMFVRPD